MDHSDLLFLPHHWMEDKVQVIISPNLSMQFNDLLMIDALFRVYGDSKVRDTYYWVMDRVENLDLHKKFAIFGILSIGTERAYFIQKKLDGDNEFITLIHHAQIIENVMSERYSDYYEELEKKISFITEKKIMAYSYLIE